ncbi:hypothetical protein D3C83_00400 [compost metagenome]
MRHGLMERQRHRSDQSGEQSARHRRVQQQQRKKKVAQQVRLHRIKRDRCHDEGWGRHCQRYRPARGLLRFRHLPRQAVERRNDERPQGRIQGPGNTQPREGCKQQRESRPINRRNFAAHARDDEKSVLEIRRDQPIQKLRREGAGQPSGREDLGLEYGRVLVHRKRMVVVGLQ